MVAMGGAEYKLGAQPTRRKVIPRFRVSSDTEHRRMRLNAAADVRVRVPGMPPIHLLAEVPNVRMVEFVEASDIRRTAAEFLAVAEEVEPRREAQVDAVERMLTEALDRNGKPDGYWRDVALATIEAAEKALFEPTPEPVGEGVTSRG